MTLEFETLEPLVKDDTIIMVAIITVIVSSLLVRTIIIGVDNSRAVCGPGMYTLLQSGALLDVSRRGATDAPWRPRVSVLS